MTKTLAELQTLCSQLGIVVPSQGRPAKEPYILALRDHFWEKENPGKRLLEQIEAMLLADWNDLDGEKAEAIERDDSGYCVQEKHDGVRALLHVTPEGVRITGRNVSEVNFRMSEFANHLPQLATGFENLVGTVLDGELVCPKAVIETGGTLTSHALQAAVAILATTPANAEVIQEQQDCRLRFVAFDVLRFRGVDSMIEPLRERLTILKTAYLLAENPHFRLAETHIANKSHFHQSIIAAGKEGTVWKLLNQPYESGKRVRHWLKRKKGMEVEALVTGFKTGTKGKGNELLIGAVEFSTVDADGVTKPIAWVCNWTDKERAWMTQWDGDAVELNPSILGKRAIVAGHDIAGRSGRYRHAKLIRWLDTA